MKQYTIHLGLFDKDTKQQEISTIDAFKVAAKMAAEQLGGATITEGRGVYTHSNGVLVEEPSLSISILDLYAEDKEDFRLRVIKFRDTLRFYFNQEEVLLIENSIKNL